MKSSSVGFQVDLLLVFFPASNLPDSAGLQVTSGMPQRAEITFQYDGDIQ